MTVAPGARRSTFNQYGPWVLGGGALLAAIAYEAARHHVIHREEFIYFLVLVPTIILHEVSHGVVANWCGDDTAKRAGRLSLNPIKHIDPLGTILLPILLIVTTGRAFGWAKPVPVSTNRLRHPRNQSVLVGLAGPATNIILAVLAGALFRQLTHAGLSLPSGNVDQWPFGDEVLYFFGYVNVIIAAFNLIPIPPLDGSAVLERLLPATALPTYYRLRNFSMLLVLFFVFFAPGALNFLFNHVITWWDNAVFG